MNLETLTVEVADGLARVTIRRPEKLNALNAQCVGELTAAFEDLAGRPEVGAVLLTGAGEKAFVAGADIAELARLDETTALALARRGQALCDRIQHLGKPVIAAINGIAFGGGCELALACHVRLASENAKIGLPEVSLGVIPGYGGTQRLAHLVGAGRAFEMILTGSPVTAQQALDMGLVNRVVPGAELLGAAETVARTILSRARPAVRFALEAINAVFEKPLAEGLELEAELFSRCLGTADAAEGIGAFLEKRKPAFVGR